MDPISIVDPGDPRVSAYVDIRERDLTGRHGRFVAEGKVVLETLFSARRFEAESVLLLENRVAGMKDVLQRAEPEMPVYVASATVMDAIAGFHIHRGVLAIGRKRLPEPASDMLAALPRRALIVVLVGISNHDNMGAIFRNAAAFGANAAIIDATSCDPLYRKAIRVSVGAVLKVPFAIVETASDIVALLTHHGFAQFGLSPSGTSDIRETIRPERAALYLGTEGEGLPKPLLDRLETVRIGMARGFDSLNVAAASAIALHHFAGDR